MMTNKELIASRVAQEFKDGDVINLGIGLPTLTANFIPKDIDVIFQSENGMLGMGPVSEDKIDYEISNAGGQPVTILEYGAFFDSLNSFEMIRGGHVDVTVLGALEVDKEGSIANWIIPEKFIPGTGGAMDLVAGAKKVIVAMEHTSKEKHKILDKCKLPLTGKGVVDLIITEMGVMEVTSQGLLLIEINNKYSIENIKKGTAADFKVSSQLKAMK